MLVYQRVNSINPLGDSGLQLIPPWLVGIGSAQYSILSNHWWTKHRRGRQKSSSSTLWLFNIAMV